MRTLARRSIYYVAVLPFGLLDLIFIFMMELKIIVSPAQERDWDDRSQRNYSGLEI
jgi:hypothetical protein